MDKPQSIVIATVGDLLDHGYTMSVWCEPCKRFGAIDLPVVAARLGRQRSYLRPSLRFRCQDCGTVTNGGQIAPPMREGYPGN